ncbi:PIG-L family deacetylase [Curtobacterium sp. ISL-83]|uniref:PIG-L family deacetylase n=1 Tax=Curtobacterium sp. ISL-83 TaxID=2819145 RepID=UPI002034BF8E|nr:PIG-L family deacetylase [Curtobacterium sp. ISL-83]
MDAHPSAGPSPDPFADREPVAGDTERVLTIVAHADDDLLFAGTRLRQHVAAGHTLRSVVLTAGDAGRTSSYWRPREVGLQESYASIAGVASRWSTSTVTVAGRTLRVDTLETDPRISIVFLQLPDGNMDGSGFWRTRRRSLQRLYDGSLDRIRTVRGADHPGTFTVEELRTVLAGLVDAFAPTALLTLDHVGSYGDGDHSDHHTVAYLADEARRGYAGQHSFTGHVGYPIAGRPVNLSSEQVEEKSAAFFTYAAFDRETCSTPESCAVRPEGSWLRREYTAA